ncbi:hypothetical protein HK102_003362, partial [Quaeritorhiza haematococci]
IVGVLINTIPNPVAAQDHPTLGDILNELQECHVTSLPHSHFRLSDVQSGLVLPLPTSTCTDSFEKVQVERIMSHFDTLLKYPTPSVDNVMNRQIWDPLVALQNLTLPKQSSSSYMPFPILDEKPTGE